MSNQSLIPADIGNDIVLESFYESGNETLIKELKNLLFGVRTRPILYLWGESRQWQNPFTQCMLYSSRKTIETRHLRFPARAKR